MTVSMKKITWCVIYLTIVNYTLYNYTSYKSTCCLRKIVTTEIFVIIILLTNRNLYSLLLHEFGFLISRMSRTLYKPVGKMMIKMRKILDTYSLKTFSSLFRIIKVGIIWQLNKVHQLKFLRNTNTYWS